MGFISDIALGAGEELAPKKKRGFIADIALGAADAPVAPSIDESMYPPDSQYAKTNRQRKAMQDAYNQGLGIEGIRAAHAKAMSDGGGDVFTGEELAKKNLLPDTDTNPTVDAFKGAALGAARGLPLINTFVPPTPLETASAPTYGIAGLKGDVAVGAAQLAGPLAAEASELMTGTKLIGGAVKGAKGMSLAIGGLNAAQSLRQNARDKRIAELQQTGEDPGLIGGLKQLDAPALGAAAVAGGAGGAMAGYGIKTANNLGGAVSNQIMNSAPARKAVEAVTREGFGEIAKRKAIEAVNSNVSGPVIRNIAKSLGADVVGGTVTQSAEMLARGQNPLDNPGQLAAGALIQGAASGAGQIASARGIIGAGRTHAANQLRSNMGAQQNALASAHDMNALPTLRDMDGNPVPPIYVAPHGEPVAGAEPIRTVEVPRGPTPFRDMDGNPIPLREDIQRNPPPINRLMLPAPENPSAPPRFPRYVSPTGEVGDVGISPSGVMRKIDDKQFIPMRKDFAPSTEAQSPEGKVIPSTEAGAGGYPPSVPNPRVANAQAELNALLQRPYLNAKMQNRAEVLRSIVNGGNPKVVAARQAAAQADAAAVIARQAAIGEDIDPEIVRMVNGMEDASAQRPLTDPTKAPIMADKEEHTPRFVQPDGNEPVRDWTEKEIDAVLDRIPKPDAPTPKPPKKVQEARLARKNETPVAANEDVPVAPNPVVADSPVPLRENPIPKDALPPVLEQAANAPIAKGSKVIDISGTDAERSGVTIKGVGQKPFSPTQREFVLNKLDEAGALFAARKKGARNVPVRFSVPDDGEITVRNARNVKNLREVIAKNSPVSGMPRGGRAPREDFSDRVPKLNEDGSERAVREGPDILKISGPPEFVAKFADRTYKDPVIPMRDAPHVEAEAVPVPKDALPPVLEQAANAPVKPYLMTIEQYAANRPKPLYGNSYKTKKEAQANIDNRVAAIEADKKAVSLLAPYGIPTSDLYAPVKNKTGGWSIELTHKHHIADGLRRYNDVNASAVDAYGIKLPEGYVREGDVYEYMGNSYPLGLSEVGILGVYSARRAKDAKRIGKLSKEDWTAEKKRLDGNLRNAQREHMRVVAAPNSTEAERRLSLSHLKDAKLYRKRFYEHEPNFATRPATKGTPMRNAIDAALDSPPKTDGPTPGPTKRGKGITMRKDRGFALNPFAPNPKRPMNAAQVDAEFDRLFSPKKPTESAIPMREPVTQAPELDATTNPTEVGMNTRVRADQFTFPERSTVQAYDSTERIESMNPKRMDMTPEELGVFKKFADDNKELIAAKIKRTTHEKVTIGAESVEINDRFINDAFRGKKILTGAEDMALGSHLPAYNEASALASAQYKVALESGVDVDGALKSMKTQNVRLAKALFAYWMSGRQKGQDLNARGIMRQRWTLDEKTGLSVPDSYVNEATKKLYNMVKGKAQADIELAIERMAAFDPDDSKGMFKFLNDLQQNGKWNAGKINLYFMSNLLSGVKTHLVNISSNFNNLVLGNTATIIDSVQMRMAGDKSRSPLGEMGAIAKGQGAGFVLGMDKAFQIIKRGYTDDAISALELPSIEFNVPFTKGMKNQEVIRGFNPWNTTLRALRAADVMFATMGFEGDLVRQALVKSRGSAEWKTATKAQRSKMIEGWRQKPTMKMLEDARKAALGATYQTGYDESTGGEFMKAFSRMVNTPVGRGPAKGLRPGAFVVPFIKTLYNIMRKNVHYSPAGLLRLMGAEDSVARAGGKSKIIAESVVLGSALVAVGKYARDNGMLEFSTPRDAGEREDFYGAKRRPNSIFGVPMKYLGPIIFPIVAGGLISDAMRKNGTPKSEKEFQKSVAQASSTMFDQSFMTQANQVMKAMSEGDWSQFGSNFASGFVPLVSFQRQTSQLADDRVREAETFGEKVVRGTYAQGNLPMRLDRFGGEIHRGGEPDPVDVEIDRLDMRLASPNQGFSREGFQPEDMPMTLLRDRLRTMQPAKEAIRNVMKGKGWESMPDYAKAKVIREIYDNFRSQGAKRAGAAFQSGRPMRKDAEYQGEKKYQRIPLR